MKHFSNELRHLAQGVGYILKVFDAIFSLAHEKIPTDRTKDVTYSQIVSIADSKRKNLAVQKLWQGETSSVFQYMSVQQQRTSQQQKSSSIATSPKLLHGSYDVIFKKFYQGTQMDRYEYIRLLMNLLPEEIISKYVLRGIEHNVYIYEDISKFMCGLPHARRIAND